MVICGSTNAVDERQLYMRRLEKVKFGLPIREAFNHGIPATLLVLLIKLNKEGIYKKDIWRAPGNQTQVRKLINIMQAGRLVNISNFSVYTAASVVKKFLGKLPHGIFGMDNEVKLFACLDMVEPEKRHQIVFRVIQSLPIACQHLLVLLFGTFRLASDAAVTFHTKMSPEAIGVSVAPSLFHSVVPDGQRARIDDVVRFRIASQVIAFIINGFGCLSLFPQENYEYYARITGRSLHISNDCTRCIFDFNFILPQMSVVGGAHAGTASMLTTPPELVTKLNDVPGVPSRSTLKLTGASFSQPAVCFTPDDEDLSATDSGAFDRLNLSLGEMVSNVSFDELKYFDMMADSTRSLSYLSQVHDRQTQRMHSRSEWFLSPLPSCLELRSLAKPDTAAAANVSSGGASGNNNAANNASATTTTGTCNEGIIRRRSSTRKHPYVRPKDASNPVPAAIPGVVGQSASDPQQLAADSTSISDYCMNLLDSVSANWSFNASSSAPGSTSHTPQKENSVDAISYLFAKDSMRQAVASNNNKHLAIDGSSGGVPAKPESASKCLESPLSPPFTITKL